MTTSVLFTNVRMSVARALSTFWRWFWSLVIGVPAAAFVVWALADNPKLFLTTGMNGLTLAALYFLVASGFTLVFGLMRNVNLAHGSLYLLGAYVGYVVGDKTGSWLLAVAAGFASAALFGLVLAGGGVPLHARRGSAPDPGDHRRSRS